MDQEKKEYTSIFKSTILFSVVKVITIISRVVINKVVSVLLGSAGIGLIGLFYSTTDLIKAFFSLGIPQSVVRDVSLADAAGDQEQFSKTICVSKRVVLFTGGLGALFTAGMSPYLSFLTFGSYKYTLSFVFLSLFVFASIVNEGQIAILRGLRNLRALAKSTLLGALLGLALDIPIYYFFGEQGIVPSLLIASFSSLLFSWWLISKVEYKKVSLSFKETYSESLDMVRLGVALTVIAILGMASTLLIRLIISHYGSISQVGVFVAGALIVTSYFGIVMGALNTDYYPRMFAVADSYEGLKKNLNSQLNAALIMLTPILCAFIFFMELIIKILYTASFLEAIDYMKFALFAIIVDIYSDTLGVVLIAKNEKKRIIGIAVVTRILSVSFAFLGFIWNGIFGLGVAVLLVSIVNLTITAIIVYKNHRLNYNKATLNNALILLCFMLTAMALFHISNMYIKIGLEIGLMTFLLYYSNKKMEEIMGINLILFFKNKLKLK